MDAAAVTLVLYVAIIIGVGILGMKKTKSFNDFFLGGGSVGSLMSAFSYATAYFSAVLFIGFAGKIGWDFGLSGLWIAFFNATVGVLGVWGVLGWKIKQMSVSYNVSTMSEFLEKRYNSPLLKLFSAFVIFVFMIPYSAAVFMGLSYLFTTNFGIEYHFALIFMGTLTAIYLVLGGYKSMALIDVIFGIIMAGGVVLLLSFTLAEGNGANGIFSSLESIQPKLVAPIGPPGFWPLFYLVFLTSIAPFAMPQLVQKFYAIRDHHAIKKGMFASTIFAALIGGVAYFTGATTRIFLTPESTPAVFAEGAPIFDRLMPELLTNIVPEALSVLILLLILSASMSTLAALVLISSSSVSKDIVAGFVNKKISDSSQTLLMRVMSMVFVILSVILAYLNIDSIVAILGISWGAIGSFFIGPFIWGLFTKKATKAGAWASGISGLATCLVLYFAGYSSPQAGTIGMIVSALVNPTISYINNFCITQNIAIKIHYGRSRNA